MGCLVAGLALADKLDDAVTFQTLKLLGRGHSVFCLDWMQRFCRFISFFFVE